MSTHNETESVNKIKQLKQHQADFLRTLITSDPEQALLKYLRTADIELRELAALHGYSLSLRLQAIDLLDKDSFNTLQRIIEYNSDSKEASAAQKKLEQLQSQLHRAKSFFIRFSKPL